MLEVENTGQRGHMDISGQKVFEAEKITSSI